MNAFGYGSGLMNRLMISEKTRKSRESLGCSRDFVRVTYSRADARQVLINQWEAASARSGRRVEWGASDEIFFYLCLTVSIEERFSLSSGRHPSAHTTDSVKFKQ